MKIEIRKPKAEGRRQLKAQSAAPSPLPSPGGRGGEDAGAFALASACLVSDSFGSLDRSIASPLSHRRLTRNGGAPE